MIIGSGNIAKVLNDREGAVFFASGISNSSSLCEVHEAMREVELLISQPTDKCLFYFSTISIFYKQSNYTKHKLNVERLIKTHWKNYNIIRIGNLDWDTNPNTFINYLHAHPEAEIKDEYRYMISKEQLTLLTDNLPLTGKNEISLFGNMAKVKDLI